MWFWDPEPGGTGSRLPGSVMTHTGRAWARRGGRRRLPGRAVTAGHLQVAPGRPADGPGEREAHARAASCSTGHPNAGGLRSTHLHLETPDCRGGKGSGRKGEAGSEDSGTARRTSQGKSVPSGGALRQQLARGAVAEELVAGL